MSCLVWTKISSPRQRLHQHLLFPLLPHIFSTQGWSATRMNSWPELESEIEGVQDNRDLLPTRVSGSLWGFLGSRCPFFPKADLPSDSLHHTVCFRPSFQHQPGTGPAEQPGFFALHGWFCSIWLCKGTHRSRHASWVLLKLCLKQVVPTGRSYFVSY